MRRTLTKLFTITAPAVVIVTVVLVLATEAWVRATHDPRKGTPGLFVPDPARRIKLAPNYTGWFAGVPVRTNSLGLRDDREYAVAKTPKTFRILVLGDSVTFGHGSIAEHTYPRLLEDLLRKWRPDIDWQVWNAAVPGYNTSQELLQLLQLGSIAKPDLGNALFLSIVGDRIPTVSVFDAFFHRRPSQMPYAQAHAIGNANLMTAETLFAYLKDHRLVPQP